MFADYPGDGMPGGILTPGYRKGIEKGVKKQGYRFSWQEMIWGTIGQSYQALTNLKVFSSKNL